MIRQKSPPPSYRWQSILFVAFFLCSFNGSLLISTSSSSFVVATRVLRAPPDATSSSVPADSVANPLKAPSQILPDDANTDITTTTTVLHELQPQHQTGPIATSFSPPNFGAVASSLVEQSMLLHLMATANYLHQNPLPHLPDHVDPLRDSHQQGLYLPPEYNLEWLEEESGGRIVVGEQRKRQEPVDDKQNVGGRDERSTNTDSGNNDTEKKMVAVEGIIPLLNRNADKSVEGIGGIGVATIQQLMENVLRVHVDKVIPDFGMPWANKGEHKSTGSAFAISSRRIITNAHVSSYGHIIRIEKPGSPELFDARVISIAHEPDLCVLTVDDEKFWSQLVPLKLIDEQPYVVEADAEEGETGLVGIPSHPPPLKAELPSVIDAADFPVHDTIQHGRENVQPPLAVDTAAPPPHSRVGAAGGLAAPSVMADVIAVTGDERKDKVVSTEEQQVKSVNMVEVATTATNHRVRLKDESGSELIPAVLDGVYVVGYPTGGDSLSVTQGIVSRVEVGYYAHSSAYLLEIQIDAAINPGNSGGPVVNRQGMVVGVAFQGLSSADSIGYIIPVNIVRHVLNDLDRHGGAYTGMVSLGVLIQSLRNPVLKDYFGVTEVSSQTAVDGVVVTNVDAGRVKRARAMQKTKGDGEESLIGFELGDVILELDGRNVAEDGSIHFRNVERVGMNYLLTNKYTGDFIKATVLRNRHIMEIQVPLDVPRYLVPTHTNNVTPRYVFFGGIVFVPLTKQYVLDFKNSRNRLQLSTKINSYQSKFITSEKEEMIVISRILSNEWTKGYHVENQMLDSVNGVKVRNLQHLAEILGLVEVEEVEEDGYINC
eukprot:GHVS01053719.1.p1 GENE.GHVS01053719.1~~GHVS01053719.1.p1  ORF type:complete len:827 (-),score=160.77 GHVS01053719.1:2470-4950(-)